MQILPYLPCRWLQTLQGRQKLLRKLQSLFRRLPATIQGVYSGEEIEFGMQNEDASFQIPVSFAKSKDRRKKFLVVLPLFEERGTTFLFVAFINIVSSVEKA